jgi:diacylglycerol kinase (ATP)
MEESNMHVLVVINVKSGSGLAGKIYGPYFKFLKKYNIRFFPYYTNGINDRLNVEKLFVHRQFDAVSVLGGDGTINMVVNSLGVEDIPIHIIPCGTGNDLIEAISSRATTHAHFDAIVERKTVEIDIFRCNDRRFSSIFGLGFDGKVCEAVEAGRNSSLPHFTAYWVAIFRNLFSFKEVRVEVNGNSKEIFMLSLANNRQVGGGFLLAPHAKMDDEILDMVTLGKVTGLQRIKNMLRLRRGRHLDPPFVEYEQVRECVIRAEREIPAQLDGELVYEQNYVIQFERKIIFYT